MLPEEYTAWEVAMKRGLLVALLCIIFSPNHARAHGEYKWIADMRFVNWFGKQCCGPSDCFKVRLIAHNCDAPLRSNEKCTAIIEYKGKGISLPIARGSVHFYSKDGNVWMCGYYNDVTYGTGHSARCLFIPRQLGKRKGHPTA
ncbi:hypothetical protein COU17_01570 [Candidatus Kaiserbacteria bacterium CG10_big_fil_rev_8_21_14_0_10_49_17]|uniref:Uncharacterized protein n=1 Tax=Candidatus Kaiserbacteria bacterium CG10_big_fil_rev_8_21_14_0_10_49_17 TaxID=1974609 RepID=A0A2M6WEG3_9BACT|nr:MAG: hypothetical protein COU17_01570 [Candidatus Kaiserbacteria bacterium CG10_big_fil_rev_8_21_14_0_10_49_17]